MVAVAVIVLPILSRDSPGRRSSPVLSELRRNVPTIPARTASRRRRAGRAAPRVGGRGPAGGATGATTHRPRGDGGRPSRAHHGGGGPRRRGLGATAGRPGPRPGAPRPDTGPRSIPEPELGTIRLRQEAAPPGDPGRALREQPDARRVPRVVIARVGLEDVTRAQSPTSRIDPCLGTFAAASPHAVAGRGPRFPRPPRRRSS